MEEQKELVGHVPVELSSLIYHFLNASSENRMTFEVTGKRKREVGLVVPAKFNALTKDKKKQRKFWTKNCLKGKLDTILV